ncbi:unnamed protein product [Spirodela intermedia]|uniref:Uncharacterized protein n=1 Tax=Spirodela intermedia TaxID=51605 RepID=A0A7I8L7U1_SPIIN|nr:unnamed protein product [Spirodela intermedia]
MEEHANGKGGSSEATVAATEEEEIVIGPGPAPRARLKRPLQFEQAYLDTLPCAHMYEKSYMHRDVVTHVAVSPADFFITGSLDGHLKFWKKKPIGIEFAKHFRSHLGPIEGLAVNCKWREFPRSISDFNIGCHSTSDSTCDFAMKHFYCRAMVCHFHRFARLLFFFFTGTLMSNKAYEVQPRV